MSAARFIAAARLEFLAEIIYYNKKQPRLGARFEAAVETRPRAHSLFLRPVRRLAAIPDKFS